MKPTKKINVTPKAATKKAAVPAAKPAKKPVTASKPARKGQAATPVPRLAPEVSVKITHVEIATRAYFIYVSAGRPHGQEMQHWLEAEAQLTRR
jgi:hypothetical protein